MGMQLCTSDGQNKKPGIYLQMFGNSRNFSPFEFTEDTGRADRQRNCNLGFKKGYSQALPGKSSSDLQKTGQRPSSIYCLLYTRSSIISSTDLKMIVEELKELEFDILPNTRTMFY
ncbi:hypothetical protein MTR_4g027360 [Medicago truncatula]|uniref:Uncharacterized protein n=1 Tax=Medicago truncatula TaxID=3880 RepID=A0A072UTG2_MEDTR|nr:hypothetical protein MTR_4g027360 [Medicago truncatula]